MQNNTCIRPKLKWDEQCPSSSSPNRNQWRCINYKGKVQMLTLVPEAVVSDEQLNLLWLKA